MKKMLVFDHDLAPLQDFPTTIGCMKSLAISHPNFEYIAFVNGSCHCYILCRDESDCRALLEKLKNSQLYEARIIGYPGHPQESPVNLMRKIFRDLVVEYFQMVPSHPTEPNELLCNVLELLRTSCKEAAGPHPQAGINSLVLLTELLAKTYFKKTEEIAAISETVTDMQQMFPNTLAVTANMDRILQALGRL